MTRIFVGNLPHSATEPELRALFSPYGHVSAVQIKTECGTNRPRGFAFVLMPSMEEADEAICRLSRVTMGGRQLTVNEARDRVESPVNHEADKNRLNAIRMFDALLAD